MSYDYGLIDPPDLHEFTELMEVDDNERVLHPRNEDCIVKVYQLS